jgi:hypothetical protein
MTPDERAEVERALVERPLPGLAEMMAMAALRTPRCTAQLEWFLTQGAASQKLDAWAALASIGHEVDARKVLGEVLTSAVSGSDAVFSRVADRIASERYDAAAPVLMDLVERGSNRRAAVCAGLLLFLGGKASTRLAMEHRDLILSFQKEEGTRERATKVLKEMLGWGG